MMTATSMISMISSRVAPAADASWTWSAMQPSQRTAMATANAASSFIRAESAPSASAF
jgi:hypothetical protein